MFGSKLEKIEKAIAKKKPKDIIALMNDKDQNVRLKAIAAAGVVGTDDSFNALVTLITDPDKDVRATAATAISVLGNAHGHEFIAHQMMRETDAGVKAIMQSAMAKLHNNE
ncbi:MAG: HEAT repeat domain-containing protein [Clostridia bacterium]